MARFTRGSTGPIVIHLPDGDGANQSISGQTRVRVVLAETEHSEALLVRDTEESSDNISIQSSPAQVTVFPTIEESLAFPVGVIVGQVWVTISDHERPSRKFQLRIEEGVGEPEE